MSRAQLSVRGAIRRPHPLNRPVEKLTIMVPTNMYPVLGHQLIRRFGCLQRPRKMVPEIDYQIRRMFPQIALYRFQRPQIPVDIRERRDSHE
jgi:hypothetical protein